MIRVLQHRLLVVFCHHRMFILQAMDKLMPGFDTEIARMAQRLLIQGRPIDYHTGVIATKVTPGVPGVKPVTIELTDFKTKKVVDTLEVDACMVATGRAPYTNGA